MSNLDDAIAEIEALAESDRQARRNDGWKISHQCEGIRREITSFPGTGQAVCVACGQWARLTVEQGR